MVLGWYTAEERGGISDHDLEMLNSEFHWPQKELNMILQWERELQNKSTSSNDSLSSTDVIATTNNRNTTATVKNDTNVQTKKLHSVHKAPKRYVARSSKCGYKGDRLFLDDKSIYRPKQKKKTRFDMNTNTTKSGSSVTSFNIHNKADVTKINPVHCLIRSEMIEPFFDDPEKNKISLRCKFCKHLNRSDREKFHTVQPKTVHGLYRAIVVRLQQHINRCPMIPLDLKRRYTMLRENMENSSHPRKHRKRTSKDHWVVNAFRNGLRDGLCDGKECIIYKQFEKK